MAIPPHPPVHVKVTGFAFGDGAHFTAANPIEGHGHGGAHVMNPWELHPVFKLEVLK